MKVQPPRFELSSVYDDGTKEAAIVPVTGLPWETQVDRRGFLGTGISVGALLGLIGACASVPDFRKENKVAKDAIKAHKGRVSSLIFSKNSNLLYSFSGKDKDDVSASLKEWNVEKGELSRILIRDESLNKSTALSMSETRNMMLTLESGNFSLYRTSTNRSVGKREVGDFRLAVLSPDGTKIISCNKGPGMEVWDVWEDAGKQAPWYNSSLIVWLNEHTDAIQSIITSRQGHLALSSSLDKTICIWSLYQNPKQEPILIARSAPMQATATSMSMGNDSTVLATGTREQFSLWKIPEFKLIRNYTRKSAAEAAIALSADNSLLAAADELNIRLIDAETGAEVQSLIGHKARITAISLSEDKKLLASGDESGVVIIWDLESKKVQHYLFDPAINKYEVKANTYTLYDNVTGTTRTYTLPCGSSVPPGATCVCNCVPGSVKSTPEYTPRTYCRCNLVQTPTYRRVCSCNKVCTCVPVCQAHYLGHSDKTIRTLARELVLFMGPEQNAYLNWAENRATSESVKSPIRKIRQEMLGGAKPQPGSWPSVDMLRPILDHDDPVIRIMAAQMLDLQFSMIGIQLNRHDKNKVKTILTQAEAMHWEKQAGYR